MVRQPFRFSPAYRLAGVPFGVRPSMAWVELTDQVLRVKFGPWRVHTEVGNISGAEPSGDYAFVKTAGPAHLSLADRGVTFATNGRRGLCLTFHDPVRVEAPIGHLRCPGLTFTPADPDGLLRELAAQGVPVASGQILPRHSQVRRRGGR